ncbi:hypothetical protein [Rhizobium sp. NZLR11]|uniref:hypothetical protein n=1 Tax=Rhizobium sp. NZLR11 TaxID=2731098 RepID=UPI00287F910D|nr:hypothetical protein [Rhizobium sp. NZLR11]
MFVTKVKVLLDDPRHQIPIGFAPQAQPIDVKAIVALILRHGHERCVEAFVNEELHEAVPEGFRELAVVSCKRFTDFTFSPGLSQIFSKVAEPADAGHTYAASEANC